METVVFILVFAMLWAWIEIVRSKQTFREQISALTHRIWALEKQLENVRRAPAPQPAPAPAPPVPAVPPPIPAFTPAAVVIPPPPPIPVFATAATAAPPPVPPRVHTPPPPPPPPPAPEPSLLERLGGNDWEALIGGNLLNKVGGLLLVIGVMWILAYYGTAMGPAGRAGCAVLVSLTLLGSGVWLERRETYRVFARGLIGAGWAALYGTAYAIYALPSARIIDNPFVGSVLVLLVAVGMVAHSLRYRSQGITAVAFFSAFAALAVTPSAPFAVISLIPLAVAVLYLAQRFNWYHMALMGVFATYGACAWHGSSGAPLIESESLFILYWVLFEIFDLMRFSRRVSGWAVELIFPLNAAGFLAVSYFSWTAKSPDNVWVLSACVAAMYLVSTLWRLKIELDRGSDDRESAAQDLPTRVRAGTYEAPLVLGAFLAATAIVQKLTGMWMSTALAMEAQALFTAGVRFRSRFLRALATVGFAASLAYLADAGAHDGSRVNVLGHMTHKWVLIVLFHALLLYVNRAISEAKSVLGIAYSWAASVLVALVIAEEMPVYLVGTGWMVLGAILFELGRRRKLIEFRWQAYLVAFLGSLASLTIYKPEIQMPWLTAAEHPWIPLAFGTAFTLAAAWRAYFIEKEDAANPEWAFLGWVACAFTALFPAVLIIREVPEQYIGVSLWGLSLALLELGLEKMPPRLRIFAYPVAAFGTLAALNFPQTGVEKFAAPQVWAPYFLAAAAAWVMSGHLSLASPEQASPGERTVGRTFLSGVGLLFALIGLWIVVPDEFVPAAWAAWGLAALEAGNTLDIRAYRLQGHAVAVIAALSAFGLTLPDGHPNRILATALLIAVHAGFFLPFRQAATASRARRRGCTRQPQRSSPRC